MSSDQKFNRRSKHKRLQIAVIGSSEATVAENEIAFQVGQHLGKRHTALLTGGRGGVMESACKGAKNVGGLTIGIVPDEEGNPYLDIIIKTRMGQARNVILVGSADAVIAIGGSYGTLSEIAFALGDNIPVFGLQTWVIEGITQGSDPIDIVEKAIQAASLYRNEEN